MEDIISTWLKLNILFAQREGEGEENEFEPNIAHACGFVKRKFMTKPNC